MKKVALLLLISQSLFSQIKYLEKDLDSYLNFTNNTAKLSYEGYSIEGTFTVEKINYYNWLIIREEAKVWVLQYYGEESMKGLDILRGDYKTVLKGLKKGNFKYNKCEVLYSDYPLRDNFYFVGEERKAQLEDELQRTAERQKQIALIKQERERKAAKFDSEIANSKFLGVYKIKISKHRNLDYSDSDVFGTIYISENGLTIKTELPSRDLLRGGYVKENSDVQEGEFFCRVNRGSSYIDSFVCIIGQSKTAGAFTTTSGRNTTTTTFRILD